MAYPNKRKGWRKIVVNGQDFRWRFIEDGESYPHPGKLVAQGTEPSGQQLEVAIADYLSWISFADQSRARQRSGISITPKLAAEAIRFGLANGWNPHQPAFTMRAVYQNGVFTL